MTDATTARRRGRQEEPEDRFPPGSDDWYRQEAGERATRLTEGGRLRLARMIEAAGFPCLALETVSGKAQATLTWLAVWDDSIAEGVVDLLQLTNDLAYRRGWRSLQDLQDLGLDELEVQSTELLPAKEVI